jgi:hypothetical protein
MSSADEEMEDLSVITGSVLVNIGTLRSETREGMRNAGLYSIMLPTTQCCTLLTYGRTLGQFE